MNEEELKCQYCNKPGKMYDSPWGIPATVSVWDGKVSAAKPIPTLPSTASVLRRLGQSVPLT